MARQVLAILLIVIGTVLAVLGATWKLYHSPQAYWSEEDAQQYNEAFLAAKAAAHSDTRRRDQPDPPELRAAREKWEKIQADLADARAARDRTGYLLGAIGLGLASFGAVQHLKLRAAKEHAKAAEERQRRH